MLHHQERPPTALAYGPAKPDDIERVRRDVGKAAGAAEAPEWPVDRALSEVEAACETIRGDVGALKRLVGSERRAGDEIPRRAPAMSDSPGESACPRCGQALSTTLGGSDSADQLARSRVSCPHCDASLVRAIDGHVDRGWQLADAHTPTQPR